MFKSRHALAATTCMVVASPAFGSDNSYNGVYLGNRTLIKGDAPSCVSQEIVTVAISGAMLKFTDREYHSLMLRFDPARDGAFTTAYEGAHGAVVDVRGLATGMALEADVRNYGSGCEYHCRLEKQRRDTTPLWIAIARECRSRRHPRTNAFLQAYCRDMKRMNTALTLPGSSRRLAPDGPSSEGGTRCHHSIPSRRPT